MKPIILIIMTALTASCMAQNLGPRGGLNISGGAGASVAQVTAAANNATWASNTAFRTSNNLNTAFLATSNDTISATNTLRSWTENRVAEGTNTLRSWSETRVAGATNELRVSTDARTVTATNDLRVWSEARVVEGTNNLRDWSESRVAGATNDLRVWSDNRTASATNDARVWTETRVNTATNDLHVWTENRTVDATNGLRTWTDTRVANSTNELRAWVIANAGLTASGGGAIGTESSAGTGGALGKYAATDEGGAVGTSAKSADGAAVGLGAVTSDGVALGKNARTQQSTEPDVWVPCDAVQLGTGLNTTPGSLQVYSYTLMGADGLIPSARLPPAETLGYYEDDGSWRYWEFSNLGMYYRPNPYGDWSTVYPIFTRSAGSTRLDFYGEVFIQNGGNVMTNNAPSFTIVSNSAFWASNSIPAISNICYGTNAVIGGWYSIDANVTSLMWEATFDGYVTNALGICVGAAGACSGIITRTSFATNWITGRTIVTNILAAATGVYHNVYLPFTKGQAFWQESSPGGLSCTNFQFQLNVVRTK